MKIQRREYIVDSIYNGGSFYIFVLQLTNQESSRLLPFAIISIFIFNMSRLFLAVLTLQQLQYFLLRVFHIIKFLFTQFLTLSRTKLFSIYTLLISVRVTECFVGKFSIHAEHVTFNGSILFFISTFLRRGH